ncbi:MAG: HD domain-containing phosphohydrolase [Candidatus Zixiibacteriota bacterium]
MTDILFVDDEMPILRSLQRAFRGYEGYSYHFASSPLEALEILAKHSITVLVSDHKMPQMSGAEFLARVKEKRPETIRMLLTGQADLEAVQQAVNGGEIFRFFLKPWKDEELRIAVKQAVDFHDLKADHARLLSLTTSQNEQLVEFNAQLEEKVRVRSSQLGDALLTARSLNEQLVKSLDGSARALIALLRYSRPDLGNHARRVADYCLAIGRKLGLEGVALNELELAALLHDCGKLYLPPFLIARDPADYRKEEADVYNLHPLLGAEALKGLKQFERICICIETHHERFDGSGFPNRLRGPEIPLEALIIGVSDEFDHLATRKRHTAEYDFRYSCQRIEEQSDKAYPARVVRAFSESIATTSADNGVMIESRVGLNELIPNAVVTKDIISLSGALLVTSGTTLTLQGLSRLRNIARIDPIVGEITIATLSKQPSAGVSK